MRTTTWCRNSSAPPKRFIAVTWPFASCLTFSQHRSPHTSPGAPIPWSCTCWCWRSPGHRTDTACEATRLVWERSCPTLERPFRTPTSRSSRKAAAYVNSTTRPLSRSNLQHLSDGEQLPSHELRLLSQRQCFLLETFNFPPATSALSPRIERGLLACPTSTSALCRFQPAHQHQLSKWPTLFSSANSDIWPAWFFSSDFDRLALAARLNSWNFFNCNEHASRGGRLRAAPTRIKDFEISPSAQDLQHRLIPALHLIDQPLSRSNPQCCETPPSFTVSHTKRGSVHSIRAAMKHNYNDISVDGSALHGALSPRCTAWRTAFVIVPQRVRMACLTSSSSKLKTTGSWRLPVCHLSLRRGVASQDASLPRRNRRQVELRACPSVRSLFPLLKFSHILPPPKTARSLLT